MEKDCKYFLIDSIIMVTLIMISFMEKGFIIGITVNIFQEYFNQGSKFKVLGLARINMSGKSSIIDAMELGNAFALMERCMKDNGIKGNIKGLGF